ncbi:MAG: hypothetical protein ACEPOW_04235 [Bacteroidales bacterium]
METSKKLVLSYFGGIFFILFLIVISIRIFGYSNKEYNRDLAKLSVKHFSLNDFSYLKCEGISNIEVYTSDSSYLRVKSYKIGDTPELDYSYCKDTLCLPSLKNVAGKSYEIKVYVNLKTFKGFISNESHVSCYNIKLSSLEYHGTRSEFYFNGDSKLDTLIAKASRCKMYLGDKNLNIQSCQLDFDKSRLWAVAQLKDIQGILKNGSIINSNCKIIDPS